MAMKAFICLMFLAFTQYALVNSKVHSQTASQCWEKSDEVLTNAAQHNKGDHIKFPFMAPCNKCVVRVVVTKPGPFEELKVTYIKENHTTITEGSVILKKYQFVCNCTIKHNNDQIVKDFRNHDKDYSASTCTKIHEPKTEFNETALKQCLNSKFEKQVEKSSHTTTNVSVSGTDMIIKYTMMRPAADPNDTSDYISSFDTTVTVNEINKVHVLNQEVTIKTFPTIDCHYPKDSKFSENMVHLCDCMQNSKIFESLPEIAVHLVFNCDLKENYVDPDVKLLIKYLSCGYDYDKDNDDKDDE